MTNLPDPTTAYDRWAQYYDIGEGDRRPFLEYYASLLDADTDSVLEIGCGTGVIAEDLARRIAAAGRRPRVVGVDASAPMLQIARQRAPTLEWIHGDMRELPVEGRFDLVFCCFNTFQFMLSDDDLQQAFAAARAHVAGRGRFAFDLYQPNVPYLQVARRDTLARTVRHDGRELQIREDSRYDADSRLLDVEWRLLDAAAPGEVLAATQFRIRQYFAADIERLLAAAGWRMVERHGDFARSPFTATSKKQVITCTPA